MNVDLVHNCPCDGKKKCVVTGGLDWGGIWELRRKGKTRSQDVERYSNPGGKRNRGG